MRFLARQSTLCMGSNSPAGVCCCQCLPHPGWPQGRIQNALRMEYLEKVKKGSTPHKRPRNSCWFLMHISASRNLSWRFDYLFIFLNNKRTWHFDGHIYFKTLLLTYWWIWSISRNSHPHFDGYKYLFQQTHVDILMDVLILGNSCWHLDGYLKK